jgi:hypothetical protein
VDARSDLFTRFEGLCLALVDGSLGAYEAAALFDVSVSCIYKASGVAGTPVTAGLHRTDLAAPWVLKGAIDSDAFKTYTAETHAKKKAQLFYLQPYFPDMSPIGTLSRSSRPRSEPSRPAPSTHSGNATGSSSIALRRKTAPTISKRRDINTQWDNALGRYRHSRNRRAMKTQSSTAPNHIKFEARVTRLAQI